MIRRGAIEDVALLQNIGKTTFQDTFGNTCTKEDMKEVLELFFNTAQCEKELTDPEDHFYFWEDDESSEVRGYVRINAKHDCPVDELKPFRSIELVRLYVVKEFHGTGVASDLMNFAIDFAKIKGYQRMYLSVWEYNFRARGFYHKYGFSNSGIKNDFPLGSTPQTDLWFTRELDS